MICKSCALGADLATASLRLSEDTMLAFETRDKVTQRPYSVGVPVAEAARKLAKLFHWECKGSGHCDCQHREIIGVKRDEQPSAGEIRQGTGGTSESNGTGLSDIKRTD